MIVDNETGLEVDKYQALRHVERRMGGSVMKPASWKECKRGDVVFCEVKGNFCNVMVVDIDSLFGVQVCTSKMEILGWTQKVSGILTEII